MTINQIQDQFIEDMSLFDEWLEKYDYIIELGKNLGPMPNELKRDEFKIAGCQSSVWVFPEYKDGKIHFYADSDAVITKGIIAMLIAILSGQDAKDIVNSDLYFIEKTGLKQNLSPTRSNGLLSMVKQIKLYAQTFIK